MPIPFKVTALEDNGVELSYPTEVLLSAANTVFTPTTTNTADNVQTAIVNSSKSLGRVFITANNTITSNSINFSTDTATTVTPGAGRWAMWFSANSYTTGISTEGEVEFFVNGVGIATSLRQAQASVIGGGLGGLTSLSISCPMTLIHEHLFTATDTLTIRYRCTNLGDTGLGTFSMDARSLLLIQTSTI